MELQDKTLKLKFDNSYNGRLFAVQGDTGRTYNLQILSDLNNVLDVSGMKLRLYIGNDKEVSYADGEVTSPEEGKFKVQVYNSQLKYPGLQKAQFVLTDKDGQKVGSKVFDLYVEEGLEVGPTLGKNILVDFETIGEALKLIRNYDKTLEEAKGVDLKLKVDIQEGTETREALVECKKKALEIKDQLDTSKTDAGKTLQDLKTTKDELKNLKTDLSSENTKAGDNIRTLGEKTEAGNSTIAGLGQSVEKAVQTDTTLKSTDTEAKATEQLLRDLLGQIESTEEEVKRIIASGDLSKYITDPKLQEALKAYATKEDLKEIDVTDQLKDYVQKDGSKVLSSNDYTNEDKAQVASIPEYLKKKDLQGQLYDMPINRMKVEKIKYQDYRSHKISEAEAGYFEEFIRRMLEDIRWATSNLDKLGSIIDYAGMGYKLSKNDYSNYDKAKVDAIPTNPKYTDTAALQTTTISDMNLLDEMGVYNNSFSSNCPNGATGKYTVFVLPTDASDAHRKNYLMQIAIKDNATNSPIYYRTKRGSSTWDSWHAVSRHTTEVLTESAYNNLSSKDDNTLYFIK